MRIRHHDLLMTSATALTCGAIVILVPLTAVRVPFAALLCLVLPGYALTSAVFARQHIGTAQVLWLTVAMSLAILAIGSVALELLPGGLRTDFWTGLLLLVVVIACAVAAFRRSPSIDCRIALRLARPRRREMTLLLIGAVAAAGAILLGQTPLPAHNAQGYTQLWMLPAASPSKPGVEVGITSDELQTRRYRLELQAGSIARVDSTQFSLRPGQSRDQFVPINPVRGNPAAKRGSTRIVAQLFRLDRPGVIYRRVFVWLPTTA